MSLIDLLHFQFFQRALLASGFVAILCGVLGPIVIAKRMSAIAGGLSHATFGGIGLSLLVGFHPVWGAALFSAALGAGIGFVYLRSKESLDTLVSLTWSFGMALGVLLMSAASTPTDIQAFLFGSLLLIPQELIWILLGINVVVLAVVWRYFPELKAVLFDEEFSQIVGGNVPLFIITLLVFVALGTVALIYVVGVTLAIALLTLPAMIARHFASRLSVLMVITAVLATVMTIGGLFLATVAEQSTALPIPPGPVIVLIGVVAYALTLACRAR